jgi:hypothetical protein
MGGSVLSFLKAEWKVSDTGSAHWASSVLKYLYQARSGHVQNVCLLGVWSLPLSAILWLDYENVLAVFCFVFHFITNTVKTKPEKSGWDQ